MQSRPDMLGVRPFSREVIHLPSGLTLEASLSVPSEASPAAENKLAICLHPWSWLGGRMDDPCVTHCWSTYSRIALNLGS